MTVSNLVFVICLVLIGVLGGCAAPAKRSISTEPGEGKSLVSPEKTIRSPAIEALLREAATKEAEGSLEQAAAIVERAIRVAPRDPVPWNRLAEIRFRQNKWSQARHLAKKSLQLVREDKDLVARNQKVIAESEKMLGEDWVINSPEF